MELRQLVQAKVSQKKETTVDTSESSAGPAEEESFAYRKLRQYFRWEYHNVWLGEDKQRNESENKVSKITFNKRVLS